MASTYRFLFLAALLGAGCVDQPGAIVCPTGIVCPDGTQCAAAQPVCILNSCGNGRVDPGEACDDGNILSGDGCSPTCVNELCGNGIQDPGERCDDGNTESGDGCSADCLSLETCGNGIKDIHEGCDDGNTVSGDGCRADCKALEFCGNGLVDVGEVCDDGMPVGGPCSPDCQSGLGCGNGFLDPGEQCDDGNTDDTDDCRFPSCKHAVCGDGIVNTDGIRVEQCDGGTTGAPTETAICNIDCTVRACGDGKVNQTAGEECDNGTMLDSATCDNDCTVPVCGDGHVNALVSPPEQCDPGTVGANVATCNANCTTPACGDGIVNKSFTPPGSTVPEGCDDGNTINGDGCSALCQIESCGNGIVEAVNGEECDDGNMNDLDNCRNNCQLPRCGDGVHSINKVPPEPCDTGGNSATCDFDCTPPVCGDGIVNTFANEQCEDGNTVNGDGCSSTCQLEPFALAVTRLGSGTGTVASNPSGINCGATCSAIYLAGTLVTLTATPSMSSTFNGWSGGGCTGTGACTVTMSQSRNVTATFEANTLTVAKGGTGSGTVSSNPSGINCGIDCAETYNVSQVVTLTAAPNGDSVFTGWSGAPGCTTATTCNVTVNQATTVVAIFTLNQFAVTVTTSGTGTGAVTSSPAGIDCGPTCTGNFTANTLVTLIPTPSADSSFIGWSGNCTGSGSCAVTMNAAKNVNARFDLRPVKLTVNTSSGGSVSSTPSGITCPNDCTENYTANTMVTLTATPNNGKVFTGWGGDCSGTTNTCTITMDVAKTVTATFVDNRLIVTKTGSGGGTVSSNPSGINCGGNCQSTYNVNTSVTLTATPNSSSVFTGWSGGGCTGAATTCVVTMNGPITVSADFEDARTLTVTKTGNGTVTSDPAGISCGAACTSKFVENSVVELTAAPASGAIFTGWGGACSGTALTCSVTMNAAKTVTATFVDTFTLDVTKAGSLAETGTVTSAPTGINCGTTCSATYNSGTSVTLTAGGADTITWSGAPTCTTGTTCVVTMSQARNVTVTFEP